MLVSTGGWESKDQEGGSVVYMGSGTTLVEGIRCWFQRCSSSSLTTIISDNPNHNNNNSNKPNKSKPKNNNSKGIVFNDNNDSHVSVSELRAQSSTSTQQEQRAGKEEDELTILEEDFDVIGSKLLKVPKRTHLRAGSMDSLKKVLFNSFSLFCDLGMLGFQDGLRSLDPLQFPPVGF